MHFFIKKHLTSLLRNAFIKCDNLQDIKAVFEFCKQHDLATLRDDDYDFIFQNGYILKITEDEEFLKTILLSCENNGTYWYSFQPEYLTYLLEQPDYWVVAKVFLRVKPFGPLTDRRRYPTPPPEILYLDKALEYKNKNYIDKFLAKAHILEITMINADAIIAYISLGRDFPEYRNMQHHVKEENIEPVKRIQNFLQAKSLVGSIKATTDKDYDTLATLLRNMSEYDSQCFFEMCINLKLVSTELLQALRVKMAENIRPPATSPDAARAEVKATPPCAPESSAPAYEAPAALTSADIPKQSSSMSLQSTDKAERKTASDMPPIPPPSYAEATKEDSRNTPASAYGAGTNQHTPAMFQPKILIAKPLDDATCMLHLINSEEWSRKNPEAAAMLKSIYAEQCLAEVSFSRPGFGIL